MTNTTEQQDTNSHHILIENIGGFEISEKEFEPQHEVNEKSLIRINQLTTNLTADKSLKVELSPFISNDSVTFDAKVDLKNIKFRWIYLNSKDKISSISEDHPQDEQTDLDRSITQSPLMQRAFAVQSLLIDEDPDIDLLQKLTNAKRENIILALDNIREANKNGISISQTRKANEFAMLINQNPELLLLEQLLIPPVIPHGEIQGDYQNKSYENSKARTRFITFAKDLIAIMPSENTYESDVQLETYIRDADHIDKTYMTRCTLLCVDSTTCGNR